jgi:hypothetical protein
MGHDTRWGGEEVVLTPDDDLWLSNHGWDDEVSSYAVEFPTPWISYIIRHPDLHGLTIDQFKGQIMDGDGTVEGRDMLAWEEGGDKTWLSECGDTGGLAELPDKPFDPCWYLNNHPDLKQAFGSDQAGAYLHWIVDGLREGRQSNRNFSVRDYLNRYPDLGLSLVRATNLLMTIRSPTVKQKAAPPIRKTPLQLGLRSQATLWTSAPASSPGPSTPMARFFA